LVYLIIEQEINVSFLSIGLLGEELLNLQLRKEMVQHFLQKLVVN